MHYKLSSRLSSRIQQDTELQQGVAKLFPFKRVISDFNRASGLARHAPTAYGAQWSVAEVGLHDGLRIKE